MADLLEIYKKNIEVVLATMGTFKSDKVVSKNPEINAENKEFIRNHMLRIYSGNVDVDILNKAIDELLPYLY